MKQDLEKILSPLFGKNNGSVKIEIVDGQLVSMIFDFEYVEPEIPAVSPIAETQGQSITENFETVKPIKYDDSVGKTTESITQKVDYNNLVYGNNLFRNCNESEKM